jgi:hypothetical protein
MGITRHGDNKGMGIKGMEGGCMDTMPTPCCMGTDGVPLRSTQLGARLGCPVRAAKPHAAGYAGRTPGSVTAGDSAGDGWGQPEFSVLVVGAQITSVDGRRLGTALGTVGVCCVTPPPSHTTADTTALDLLKNQQIPGHAPVKVKYHETYVHNCEE